MGWCRIMSVNSEVCTCRHKGRSCSCKEHYGYCKNCSKENQRFHKSSYNIIDQNEVRTSLPLIYPPPVYKSNVFFKKVLKMKSIAVAHCRDTCMHDHCSQHLSYFTIGMILRVQLTRTNPSLPSRTVVMLPMPPITSPSSLQRTRTLCHHLAVSWYSCQSPLPYSSAPKRRCPRETPMR